jgi:beta-galactosidase
MRIVFMAALFLLPASLMGERVSSSFDADWRFLKADAPGAEKPAFDDAHWRTLNVPHDWGIEGPFDAANPAGGAGAFLPGGVGWYRKQFHLPAGDAKRQVFIEFDGVMANSDVWINGFHLGQRPYGYVSFRYELSGHVNFGDRANTLAVRADNAGQPASRWYAGAGIYRHVRLVVTDPIHLDRWATVVTTPNPSAVHVKTSIVNRSAAPRSVALEIAIAGPDGKPLKTVTSPAQTIAAGASAAFEQDIGIANPALWDLEHPVLYHAIAMVRAGKATLDSESIPFGIREFHFDAATGFWLNGRNFKIKGVCLHPDAGAFGTAVPLAAWERRLATLKQLGVNAIRTAHNPAAPEFLDLCDRMGFLVMDEMFDTWLYAKNQYDYHLYFKEWSKIDTRDTVMRDRNHPSIVLYSAGNEIRDTPKADVAKQILTGLRDTFHEYDPTRPVTQALFRPNVSHDYDNGLADILDVIGQNYRENEIVAAHRQNPARKIIGTENGHDRKVWLAMRDDPAYAGQFLWSGIDYLGESRAWPIVSASSGLLDRTGAVKPVGYERQSWWSAAPMVRIARRTAARQATPTDPGYEPGDRRPTQTLFLDWTPLRTEAHSENVEVYSNGDAVELLLNGKSLGAKPRASDDSPRTWSVPFEAGTLQAIAKDKSGQIVAKDELRTAGKAAKLALSADRNQISTAWDDAVYLTVTVVDAHGVPVPAARDAIAFQVEGPGILVGVDSADSASHELFQASQRRAYQGRCIAILKASGAGRITLRASADGLGDAAATIDGILP